MIDKAPWQLRRPAFEGRYLPQATRGVLELAARAKIIGFVSNWKPHKCSTTADRLIVVFAAVEDLACSLIDN